MDKKRFKCFKWMMAVILIPLMIPSLGFCSRLRTLTDFLGRDVNIPRRIDHTIGSGSGCLRIISYLQAQDMVVAVDNLETRKNRFESRPYALANPQFKGYPIFGEFRGHDHPERIISLTPLPQVILKTYATMGYDPIELQQKTGIPVVSIEYGDLGYNRQTFFKALRISGQVLNKVERAEAIIAFFKSQIAELKERTKTISRKPTCFVGGIAYRGAHGFQSTEPSYPPFQFVNAVNVAMTPDNLGKNMSHSIISREKLMEWDPDVLFLDLSTLQMNEAGGGFSELENDPALNILTAVKKGRIFGVLPYNWYSQNFGSIIANAWFIGKTLYPERFKDIDPAEKADEIYTFLVGSPVFKAMDRKFANLAFKKIDLKLKKKD